jgi:hypothetical protein
MSRKLPPLPDEGITMKNGVLHYTPIVEIEGACVSFEELAVEAEESESLVAVGQELFDMVENVVLDKREYSQREWFIIARYLMGALEGVKYAVVGDNN